MSSSLSATRPTDGPLRVLAGKSRALRFAAAQADFSADHDAYKNVFVAVFQAWAKGTINGTAEQVFEAAKSVLEGWDAQRP